MDAGPMPLTSGAVTEVVQGLISYSPFALMAQACVIDSDIYKS